MTGFIILGSKLQSRNIGIFNSNVCHRGLSCFCFLKSKCPQIVYVLYSSQNRDFHIRITADKTCFGKIVHCKFCFKFHMWHCWVKRIQPKYKITRAVSGSAGAALGPLYQVANSICISFDTNWGSDVMRKMWCKVRVQVTFCFVSRNLI